MTYNICRFACKLLSEISWNFNSSIFLLLFLLQNNDLSAILNCTLLCHSHTNHVFEETVTWSGLPRAYHSNQSLSDLLIRIFNFWNWDDKTRLRVSWKLVGTMVILHCEIIYSVFVMVAFGNVWRSWSDESFTRIALIFRWQIFLVMLLFYEHIFSSYVVGDYAVWKALFFFFLFVFEMQARDAQE